jgi:hypothetical protein
MVVAKKWIGTEEDRNDMERLKLEQVVRVRSLSPFLITILTLRVAKL